MTTKKTLSPRYSQLGDSSKTDSVSVLSPTIFPCLSNSPESSSSFSDLRWRVLWSLYDESVSYRSEARCNDTYEAFFLPHTLGFDCASIIAAYSESRALCKCEVSSSSGANIAILTLRSMKYLNNSVCPNK